VTWLDVTLLVIIVLCIAVGARLGSLWTAACLAGGFSGAFLADMYALSLAGAFARFPGGTAAIGALLFVGGAALFILPGIILSKLFSGLMLGVVDSIFGFVLGAFTGLLAVTAILLIVFPYAPKIENTPAWKKSKLVRPLHRSLEDIFQSPRFTRRLSGLGAARAALSELEPLTEKAESRIKGAAGKVIDKAKK
jgi:uncharacterized membrane protein required for colicin V production